MDVIYVLWLRQVKRYVRSRARIIGSLGQPLLFLIGLGFGLGPVFQKAGQGNYIQFLAPGVIAMTVLFTSVFSGIELIWDRQFGFLKETLVAPVSRLTIMIGRVLGGATVAVGQGLIVCAFCLLAGFRFSGPGRCARWPSLFMALIALLFTALGTAIASAMSDFQGFQLVMNFLVMPTFFLSGALFPLRRRALALEGDWPASIRSLTASTACGARSGGVAYFHAATDVGVLAAVTAGLMFLGGYLFSRIEL